MNWITIAGCAACLSSFTPMLAAQTEPLYSIDVPTGVLSAWGSSLATLDDLNGDGIRELAIGGRDHGGGKVASVHNGADGALLFTLDVPFVPMFIGSKVTSIGDINNDKVSDIALIGSQSGDSNSPAGKISLHSGSDGTLLQQIAAPAGIAFHATFVGGIQTMPDIDGDGVRELMVKARGTSGLYAQGWAMIAPNTGVAHYIIFRTDPLDFLLPHAVALLSDHDGDDLDDFAIPTRINGTTHFRIHSTATGAILNTLALPPSVSITGNGEPFVGIDDIDGDGLKDIAIGTFFDGHVSMHSTGTGATLHEFICATDPVPCMGSRIVQVGDMNFDGHGDLLVIEVDFGTTDPLLVFGLDPLTGKEIFRQSMPELVLSYTHGERIIPIPGIDPSGFPTFAITSDLQPGVTVLRFAPELGRTVCQATSLVGKKPVNLRALGSSSLSDQNLVLELRGGFAHQTVAFAINPRASSYTQVATSLCVGQRPRLGAAALTDSSGFASAALPMAQLLGTGRNWTMQAIFRDPSTGLIAHSNALLVPMSH